MFKKHDEYQIIKAGLVDSYKDMDRVRLYMFAISAIFLGIVIWNILHLKGPHGYSFWLWLLRIEHEFKCDAEGY